MLTIVVIVCCYSMSHAYPSEANAENESKQTLSAHENKPVVLSEQQMIQNLEVLLGHVNELQTTEMIKHCSGLIDPRTVSAKSFSGESGETYLHLACKHFPENTSPLLSALTILGVDQSQKNSIGKYAYEYASTISVMESVHPAKASRKSIVHEVQLKLLSDLQGETGILVIPKDLDLNGIFQAHGKRTTLLLEAMRIRNQVLMTRYTTQLLVLGAEIDQRLNGETYDSILKQEKAFSDQHASFFQFARKAKSHGMSYLQFVQKLEREGIVKK